MAPRGTQNKDALKKNRLKRISGLKAQIAQLEKQGGTGKGSFRTKTKISQLKKKLRDLNAGYQKITPTNTKKKLVKTSRGLKIRNVANKPKKKYNDGKMSNIPAGEATVNNPNYGKKPKKTESNTATESSTESSSNGSSSKTENKIDTKTAFSQDKPLVEKNKTEKKTETKRYGRAPKGYIKTGGKFASLKSVKGKRAKMRQDRLKILQDKIKKNKKKKVDG